ncbi:hypothetical protein KIN20_016833 [Parelaphostrongylus tenuis]|uniref:Uncharacterized protein n=1 Tax=Parelaphostrongylus tenuis TaxID=148309 RepID=A0AAD5MMB2_PARTN|nr:hypothetical protein KIN20_016833 [Parelaphostrongylus tenuis]
MLCWVAFANWVDARHLERIQVTPVSGSGRIKAARRAQQSPTPIQPSAPTYRLSTNARRRRRCPTSVPSTAHLSSNARTAITSLLWRGWFMLSCSSMPKPMWKVKRHHRR